MSAPSQPAMDSQTFFHNLENYPWQSDSDFQSGLHAILGSSSSPSAPAPDPIQVEELTLRARCFYYERKYGLEQPIDFEAYSSWRNSRPSGTLSDLSEGTVSHELGMPDGNSSSVEGTPAKPSVISQSDGVERNGQQPSATASGVENGAADQDIAASLSFQEIMDMIQNQKPIPGIKDIPDTVLQGQGTQSSKVQRQKPWEQAKAG